MNPNERNIQYLNTGVNLGTTLGAIIVARSLVKGIKQSTKGLLVRTMRKIK